MKSVRHLVHVFLALEISTCFWFALTISQTDRQVAGWRQARPLFTPADVWTASVAATFEAQVLPEPYRSQAYRAIVWTMRNRVLSGYDGIVGYSDERLLAKYVSYSDHRQDVPEGLAWTSALQVMGALTSDDDPTKGARHYVDNSYWTGTHEQTGNVVKFRGMYNDVDVQRMVDDGRFTFTVEWKSSPEHPKGQLFYGLYFFDTWPPPSPAPAPMAITAGTAPTAGAR